MQKAVSSTRQPATGRGVRNSSSSALLNAPRRRPQRRRAAAGALSQTSATSATNSIDDSQNRSVAAIVKACWSTMRLSVASACSRLWPARCRSASACTAAGLDRLMLLRQVGMVQRWRGFPTAW